MIDLVLLMRRSVPLAPAVRLPGAGSAQAPSAPAESRSGPLLGGEAVESGKRHRRWLFAGAHPAGFFAASRCAMLNLHRVVPPGKMAPGYGPLFQFVEARVPERPDRLRMEFRGGPSRRGGSGGFVRSGCVQQSAGCSGGAARPDGVCGLCRDGFPKGNAGPTAAIGRGVPEGVEHASGPAGGGRAAWPAMKGRWRFPGAGGGR
jgi:hypothetical protein